MTHFKGKKFKKDRITIAIGYYLIYNSSYRVISEIMSDPWIIDETYIKVKEKWHYLYRAIDSPDLTLDIWL